MSDFDAIALTYDDDFTDSCIGKLQRQRVYYFLSKILKKEQIENVLELNCGTGTDAIWLAQQGCQVLATDISRSMIEVANQKIVGHCLEDSITGKTLAIEKLKDLNFEKKYDLIFSNFGGLNCLSPTALKAAAVTTAKLLKPNGVFVAVVMPRFCWWESLYFSLKGQWAKAKRRRSNESLSAPLNDSSSVATWYYNPIEFFRLFEEQFQYEGVRPIGFMLPPSYLENWFSNKPLLLKILNRLESFIPRGRFTAAAADHFLLQLSLK